MNALFDAYYYGVENGEVQGPLPLESIGAKILQGEAPEWVMLSRTSGGPWAPLGLVRRLGDEAFDPPAKAKPKPTPMAKPGAGPCDTARPRAARPVATAPIRPATKKIGAGSVAGFYEVLGFIAAAMGALNIGFGVSFAASGNPLWWPCAAGMLTCFVIALGLLATAEILNRLRAISESVREMAERTE